MTRLDWLKIFVLFIGVAGLFAGVGLTSHGVPTGIPVLGAGFVGVGVAYAGLRKG